MKVNRFERILCSAIATAVALLLAAAQPARAQTGAGQMPDPTINPATGEPFGAPTGCCCFPKADTAPSKTPACKPNSTQFDCKAECADLRDGRLPSSCSWTQGDCPK
jgi:hypothetical protein